MYPRSRGQVSRYSSMDSLPQIESQPKKNKKYEFNSSRVSPIPSGGSQWGANVSKSSNPVFGSSKKFFSASVPGSRIVSRATSPISRRSPPRSTTPTPTLSGLMLPNVDDAKRTNDSLSQEVIRLRAQVQTYLPPHVLLALLFLYEFFPATLENFIFLKCGSCVHGLICFLLKLEIMFHWHFIHPRKRTNGLKFLYLAFLIGSIPSVISRSRS